MSAVAHVVPMPRGPIEGTLSDADVKALLVRAARVRSIPDLHAVIKVFVLNRLALAQVIESLTSELRRSASAASQFDVALLDQLKVIRTELDAAQHEREQARANARTSADQLIRAERMHDVAQRLAEQVQRELLMVSVERERLGQENASLTTKISEQTATLQQLRDELSSLGERLALTDSELGGAIAQGRAAIAERDTARAELAASTTDTAELRRRLQSQERLVADLREAVRSHLLTRHQDRKMMESLSVLLVQLQREHEGLPATQPIGQAPATGNVVAFSNRAEIDRLREQIRARDTAIVTKDQTITRLSDAHGLLKSRMAEVETRLQQIDIAGRAQSVANETLAKTLLTMLPADLRGIYSSSSYDASSLLLMAEAARRHAEKTELEEHHGNDGVGRAM